MDKRHLEKIIQRVGSQELLAEELFKLRPDRKKIRQQTISWWMKDGVPAAWVPYVIKIASDRGIKTHPKKLNPIFGQLPA